MRLRSLLAAGVALFATQFAHGATQLGTPVFWDALEPAATPTSGTVAGCLAAGSNRMAVLYVVIEVNTDPAPTGVTIGGNAFTETIGPFHYAAGAQTDQRTYAYILNEAAIAALPNNTIAYSDGASNAQHAAMLYCAQNVDQTALGAFDGTVSGSNTTLNVATASASGDLIIASGLMDVDTNTFTGWDTLTELRDTDSGAHRDGFAAGNGGDATTTVTVSGSNDYSVTALVFLNAPAAGEFDVDPAVASETATAYTVDGSLDASGTVHGAACPVNQTPPTIVQIQNADCTGDVNALASDSESTANNFSLLLTLTNDFPVADLYFTDGTNIVVITDAELDCPLVTNCEILTSIHTTSPFFGTVVAVGDYAQIDSLTDPDAYATFLLADGTVSYAAVGDTSRQLIGAKVYDVSAEAMVEFLIVFNNGVPTLVDEWPLVNALYELGVDPAFTAEDYVDDPESDDMTWSVTSGALPTDWLLNADTSVISDGSPGACGGYDFVLRATDIYEGFTDFTSHVEIGARVPDVAGDDESTAVMTIEALCGFTTTEAAPSCSATAPIDTVISTSPAIGTLVGQGTVVSYVMSTGPCLGGSSFGGGYFLQWFFGWFQLR